LLMWASKCKNITVPNSLTEGTKNRHSLPRHV